MDGFSDRTLPEHLVRGLPEGDRRILVNRNAHLDAVRESEPRGEFRKVAGLGLALADDGDAHCARPLVRLRRTYRRHPDLDEFELLVRCLKPLHGPERACIGIKPHKRKLAANARRHPLEKEPGASILLSFESMAQSS